MRLVIVTAVAVATSVACSTPYLPAEPDPVATSQGPSKRAPGGVTSDAPAAPSNSDTAASARGGGNGESADAGPLQHWRGDIAATAPVDFGGAGYCDYQITLKQVSVDVTVTENGEVVAATVTALATEALLSSCPNPAIPANMHTYTLGAHASSTVLPSGALHLELAPAATNRPQASLVLEGDFKSANAAASLAWHRTDVGPPVDWKVDATVTGSPQ